MDGISTAAKDFGQTVEFRGHLIDSLTLSKIADQVLLAGGHYELNDIRIGTQKKDFSSVNMTVFAENEAKLKGLLEELSHYGAIPSGQANVEVCPCPQDGVPPEEAFAIKLPGRVFHNNQWLTLQGGQHTLIVIHPERNEARFVKVSELRKGDLVVSGTLGIEW